MYSHESGSKIQRKKDKKCEVYSFLDDELPSNYYKEIFYKLHIENKELKSKLKTLSKQDCGHNKLIPNKASEEVTMKHIYKEFNAFKVKAKVYDNFMVVFVTGCIQYKVDASTFILNSFFIIQYAAFNCGLVYGYLGLVLGTFKAVDEGYNNKFCHCLIEQYAAVLIDQYSQQLQCVVSIQTDLNVTDTACCEVSSSNAKGNYVPNQVPCSNRQNYMFWDAYHPTERVSVIDGTVAYEMLYPLYSSETISEVLGGTTRRKQLLSPKSMDGRSMMEVVKGAAFGILQVIQVFKEAHITAFDSKMVAVNDKVLHIFVFESQGLEQLTKEKLMAYMSEMLFEARLADLVNLPSSIDYVYENKQLMEANPKHPQCFFLVFSVLLTSTNTKKMQLQEVEGWGMR
ncbi:GDSL esterase/lipase-like protein [Tanacetum coccineum]